MDNNNYYYRSWSLVLLLLLPHGHNNFLTKNYYVNINNCIIVVVYLRLSPEIFGRISVSLWADPRTERKPRFPIVPLNLLVFLPCQ